MSLEFRFKQQFYELLSANHPHGGPVALDSKGFPKIQNGNIIAVYGILVSHTLSTECITVF